VFVRLATEWDGFSVGLEELLDAGDAVVATGRYSGAHRQTGTRIHAQFAHVWKLRGGKVLSFQQYADTLQVTRAAGS
jgi:ketosteroid isomerase-like protein